MEHENQPSPTLLETCRSQITLIFAACKTATGYPPTFISQVVLGDRAFATRYKSVSMSVVTFDNFMGRLSSIWPDGAAWPESVPRPKPVPLTEAGRALMDERRASKPSDDTTQPGDWPDDIPRPQPRS